MEEIGEFLARQPFAEQSLARIGIDRRRETVGHVGKPAFLSERAEHRRLDLAPQAGERLHREADAEEEDDHAEPDREIDRAGRDEQPADRPRGDDTAEEEQPEAQDRGVTLLVERAHLGLDRAGAADVAIILVGEADHTALNSSARGQREGEAGALPRLAVDRNVACMARARRRAM